MLSLKINKNKGVLQKGFAVKELAALPAVRNNHP